MRKQPIDSQADILKAYLVRLGIFNDSLVPSSAWLPFTSSLPDGPDYAVCFYDCRGNNFGRLMRGATVEHFGVDITIRSGSSYPDGRRMGDTIQDIADEAVGVLVYVRNRAYLVKSIYRPTQLVAVGEEPKKRRQLFTLMLRMVIVPSGVISPVSPTSQTDVVGPIDITTSNTQVITSC